MKTTHQVYFSDSRRMEEISDHSVDLVVTSPPYPMIEMWDAIFKKMNPEIDGSLSAKNGHSAFELMHGELDPVWAEAYRIIKNGGFICINIGDATRTIGGNFMLYPNHARILSALIRCGFTPLPSILWRKQTNAPNKFMGSGMLPAGAYVTLEHEYILILRKGSKRQFGLPHEKQHRRESALFWEERNDWYSDVWMNLKGTNQKLKNVDARIRSAAFPFEVPYRLISMYSAKGDVILDPFLGTGTTMKAAIAAERSSIGFETEKDLQNEIFSEIDSLVGYSNTKTKDRLQNHLKFIQKRCEAGKVPKYTNEHYGFPVVTRQEKELRFNFLKSIGHIENYFLEAIYSEGSD